MTDQPSSTKWTSLEDNKLHCSENSEEEQLNDSKNAKSPKLCDIILQNLNLKYKQSIKSKSGNYSRYTNCSSNISQRSNMEGLKKPQNQNEEFTTRVSTDNDSGLERSTFSGVFSPNNDLRQSRFNKFKSISNVDNNILTLHPVQRVEESENSTQPKIEMENNKINKSEKENGEIQIAALNNSKVPNLLNNIKNMYDLNSDRVKKRSEQMKKRIVKTKPDEEDHTLFQNQFNLLNNNDNLFEEPKTTNPNLSRNLNLTNFKDSSSSMLKYRKTYQDEENDLKLSPFSDDQNRIVFKSSDNSLSQPVSLNSYNQTNSENDEISREPEVVISDLECDIEEDDLFTKTNCIPNSGKNKSFIPLQNHLKKEVQVEKATPSYLMALLGYDENNSKLQSESEEETSDGNAVMATLNTKHNYDVDEVIEEENSGESNTDSDKSFIKSCKIKSRQTSELSNSLNSQNVSPLINPSENKRTVSFSHVKHPQSFNSHIKNNSSNIGSSCSILLPSIHKIIQSRSQNNSLPELIKTNLNLHKNSKSAYTDVRVDMKRVLDGIGRRKLSEKEERLEKIKLRKNILLNNFCKSNSHHNFPNNFKISSTSNFSNENNENETPSKKKLSICVDTSNNYGNSYRKLSPSCASRAFYYDYEGEEQNNSKINNNNDYINFNCDDEEEENGEEGEDEVIQNRSIIEIKDEGNSDFEDQILNNENIKIEENSDDELDYPLVENEVFEFNPTPNESKRNTAEKVKKQKSIFISEDMKISQTGKIDVIQSASSSKIFKSDYPHSKSSKSNSIVQLIENTTLDKNNYNSNCVNTDTLQNKSINFNSHKSNNLGASEKSFKSIKSNYSNKSFKSYTSNNRKPYSSDYSNYKQSESSNNNENVFINNLSNNFKFTFSSNFEISKSNLQILSEENKNKKSQSDIPSGFDKLVYNNNFISNNFNNISINILNSEAKDPKDTLVRDSKNQIKIKFKKKTNSLHTLTQEIKHKIGHNKSNSKTSTFLDEKIRSSSFNKSMSAKKQKSNNFNSFLNFVSPKKTFLASNKPVLKQYLTYSDTKSNVTKDKPLNYFTNFTSTNFYENVRVNSDTSVKSILSSSNKHTVIEAMKSLKFHISSLDHQKFSLEKLYKSKSKFFCILVSTESKENQKSKYSYEFKALYEMNIEKNNLTKVYAINYYPHTIEFAEVKSFYQFDLENEQFKLLKFNDIKTFSSDIHAFYMQFNFKKFYKV